MTLVKSKSKKAFKENIRAEVNAGKPVKQAVAIAYSEKRRSSKKREEEMKTKGKVVPYDKRMLGIEKKSVAETAKSVKPVAKKPNKLRKNTVKKAKSKK